MAFLPTGLVKATGQRFTLLSVETPVGFFFEALYQTGPFWIFIGVMQVVASILLLIPRTATLGALLFLPVGTSIFLVTWGLDFGLTTYVTGGMLLACIYLVCWDGDRVWAAIQSLFGQSDRQPLAAPVPLLEGAHRAERIGWGLGAASGMGFFLMIRGFLPAVLLMPVLGMGAVAVALVVAGWLLTARQWRAVAP
ncbi:MAG: hypothetical protein GVY12_07295 [Bacteroidetes bacterium]|nr:hypothetical protein [Bacteroidota bacterium]